MRDCNGQCHGCAFKPGAAANQEPQNKLRGFISAVGGLPFYCHESLGWKGKAKHYPVDATNSFSILLARPQIIAAGADPAKLNAQVAEVQRNLRVCGGWKAAIARLKKAGWFSNREVTFVRRHMAKLAARDLADFTDTTGNPETKAKLEAGAGLEEGVRWFLNEAREVKIKIGWLMK